MMVFARAMTVANSLEDSGPASMPSKPAGMPLANVALPTFASGPNLSPVTQSTGR